MINGNLDQFLDTGWFSEATIYYDGYVYWCEATTNFESGINHFFVDRWRAKKGEDNLYHSLIDEHGELTDYDRILEIENSDLDMIKKQFLEARIFDGKSFWAIEKQISWLEEGTPIINE
ncbi:MAG: hypothetical protein J6Y08_07895 [Clostridiales bacterium]|nr:hypothetical protein [Clostridiales bacterium]